VDSRCDGAIDAMQMQAMSHETEPSGQEDLKERGASSPFKGQETES
jgi:hypothetical protein